MFTWRYVHFNRIVPAHPLALETLELDEYLGSLAVAALGPGGHVASLDSLLAGALAVRADVPRVPQLRPGPVTLVADPHVPVLDVQGRVIERDLGDVLLRHLLAGERLCIVLMNFTIIVTILCCTTTGSRTIVAKYFFHTFVRWCTLAYSAYLVHTLGL